MKLHDCAMRGLISAPHVGKGGGTGGAEGVGRGEGPREDPLEEEPLSWCDGLFSSHKPASASGEILV